MLIRLFRTSQPMLAFFLLIPVVLSGFGSYFLHFKTVAANGMPFYDAFLSLVINFPSWVRITIVSTLIYLQAIHLHIILTRHEVLYKESWIPALMYVVCATYIPDFQWFHPMIFVNTIMLFAIDRMFHLYKNDKPLAIDFDTGFFIGLASLFYLPLLIYIFFFGAALILLRPFSWRDWVTGIIGVVLPLFFTFCYYVLSDRFMLLYEKIALSGIRRPQHIEDLFPKAYSYSLILIIFLAGSGLLKQQINFYKNVTRTRLNQLVIIMFAITAALAAVFAETPQLYRFYLLAIPAAIWIGYFFLSLKRVFLAEIIFLIITAAWIYNYIAV